MQRKYWDLNGKRMRGAYIILTHKYRPVTQGENAGKMQAEEICEFTDAIKNKQIAEATVIVDVLNKKLAKNRLREQGNTYEEMEAYLLKSYEEKVRDFYKMVGTELSVDPTISVEENGELTVSTEANNE